MLYERWLQIARSSPRELALRDLVSNRRWTFHELEMAAESAGGEGGTAAFPVCPVEADQRPPELPGGLPAGIVHLKMTSGTTAAPRFVAFTAGQLAADAENIVTTMGLRTDWPNVGVISLAHSYGFSNLVLPLLLHGIPLVLAGAPLPEMVMRAAATESDVTVAAVPALWRTWHEAGAIPRNVRLAISAGAPLPVALEEQIFAATGLKVHNFYGSSECGGIAFDRTSEPRRDDSCAGVPMQNVSVAIAENGCLEVRSQAVGQGYWPQANESLGHGVFRTNDLVEIADRLVYFRGRAGDQINVAGRKVAPDSIEKVLVAHPGVRECVVFGVPSSDAQRGDTIVACVSASTSVSGEMLKQYLLEHLPAWQVPREWWLVESLFANPRGKLSRSQWRKRYLERVG